jgi:HSP20 family protein
MMNRRSSIPGLWREMQRFQNEMNRVFDNSLSGAYYRADNSPSMNIFTSEDEVLVNAEVPGVDIKDLEISVVGNNLTISGNRDPEVSDENTTYHRQERISGYFSRSIELPYQVDSEKTEASLEDGVLKIVLPRAEADKPRRISVKTS